MSALKTSNLCIRVSFGVKYIIIIIIIIIVIVIVIVI